MLFTWSEPVAAQGPEITVVFDPPTAYAMVAPGRSFIEDKLVEISAGFPEADVVFAFDVTGSMGGILGQMKQQATAIMQQLSSSLITDAQFGLIYCQDYPPGDSIVPPVCGYNGGYGSNSDYPYKLEVPLEPAATAITKIQNRLTSTFGFGGGDSPESYTRVLYESYNDASIGWRPTAAKFLILFADDVPHDCDINDGIYTTVLSTGADPGPNGLASDGDDLVLLQELANMSMPPNDITLLFLSNVTTDQV
jgi:hypothetical protein